MTTQAFQVVRAQATPISGFAGFFFGWGFDFASGAGRRTGT
jgi:hypothetical protein